jgi:hypothetical protein
MPTQKKVRMLPATAALPAVATLPATATLPDVAIDPATATLPAVATEPATATLPAVAIDPATAKLPAVESFLGFDLKGPEASSLTRLATRCKPGMPRNRASQDLCLSEDK